MTVPPKNDAGEIDSDCKSKSKAEIGLSPTEGSFRGETLLCFTPKCFCHRQEKEREGKEGPADPEMREANFAAKSTDYVRTKIGKHHQEARDEKGEREHDIAIVEPASDTRNLHKTKHLLAGET